MAVFILFWIIFDLCCRVIDIIYDDFTPLLEKHAIAGELIIRTPNPTFVDNHLALDMIFDVLSERGYQVVITQEKERIPYRIDLKTGDISTEIITTTNFAIRFKRAKIRAEPTEGIHEVE